MDSLKQLFYNQPINVSSIQICHEIALLERQINADSANHYFKLAIQHAAQKNTDIQVEVIVDYSDYLMSYANQHEKADSIIQIGIRLEKTHSNRPLELLTLYKWKSIANGVMENVEASEKAITDANQLIESNKFTDKELGIYYSDISQFYGIIGKFDLYTSSLLTAIEYYEKIDDVDGISIAYLNLAIKHVDLEQYNKVKDFGEKALDVLQDQNNAFLMGHCNVILMVANSELQFSEQAKSYGETALTIWRKLNNTVQEASILRNLSTLNRKSKNYDIALVEINESIALFQKLNIPEQLLFCWAEKAVIQAERGRQLLSTQALDSFYQIEKSLNITTTDKMSLLKTIEQVHATNENYQEAYIVQQELNILKDSLITSENLAKVEELEAQYFTKEKDAALALQKSKLDQQKTIMWIFGLLLISLLALVFVFWKNVRYRKQVNKRLLELDTAKSRFFTNISHELRTPLTLILAPLSESLKKIENPSIKEELQLAHSNGKKLADLINEILDLSKIEGGKMKLKETPVALEQLLRRILYSYHSFAQMRNFILAFSYHLPQELGVLLDVEKIEKVLNNLLSNAFKHSNPGGVITLRVSSVSYSNSHLNSKNPSMLPVVTPKKMIKIEVQDTGKGIPNQEIAKIFDRFYQIDDSSQPLQGGTGIGLSYAKETSRFMGGDLFVESELGKGSNFIFYLPLKKVKIESIVEDKNEVFEHTIPPTQDYVYRIDTDQKSKILIVEDNPEMSDFLTKILADQYECDTAMDGQIALEKIKKGNFNLIISDVMMPNMDGFELLKELKQLEKQKHIPVILLTARAMEEDKLNALRLGVDDYLTKPFSVPELIARTKNLIQNKAIRDEVAQQPSLDSEPSVSLTFEQQQLKKAETIVFENIGNGQFKVDDLASQMNYSRRQLERIIKKRTGLTPGGLIREIRLQKARQLLESRQFATIAEVRYAVGFDNASHFSKIFQDRFGIKPSMV
ncbi:MAG: response regulator [Saprospiraceae bacterium]|nr:response regulator [Saprospiraceae bacterium]